MAERVFIHEIDVEFEDLDAGHFVYNVNYFKFCDRARNRMLSSLGLDVLPLLKQDSVFAVGTVTAKFLKPVAMEKIYVLTKITGTTTSTLTLHQVITATSMSEGSANFTSLEEVPGACFFAEVRLVFGSLSNRKAQPIPASIKEKLKI
jgi:YbgC/YbaW family acyl-CoA thioester hydrolase